MDSLKRKRSRRACKPCRERKRKCDGNEPCTTCTDWGYDCLYEPPTARPTIQRHLDAPARAHSQQQTPHVHVDGQGQTTHTSKTSKTSHTATPVTQSPPSPFTSINTIAAPASAAQPPTCEHSSRGAVAKRREANSGAAFVRKLGLKIDPTKAPKLSLFGWNLGARQLTSPGPQRCIAAVPALSIAEITSHEHMRLLAHVYFELVDPCYGFIDREHFLQRLDACWTSPAAASSSNYDSVLAGVAALGCAFSQHHATITELSLVRAAQTSLDITHHLSGPPSMDLLTGWALRTIYLRITDSPHATWIASCTLMHLVEASGLHTESPLVPTNAQQQHLCHDAESVRRLVGVAHHLNAWTSFDLGLRRVLVDLPALPSAAWREGDFTAEVLGLLPVSISLDPNSGANHDTDLTATLGSVLAGRHTRPPSVMAQCNLVLCILRRIHAHNLDLSPSLGEQVLSLLRKGLDCARSLVRTHHPWHQVANVPFNMICVLLTMDTRASLALLPETMQTLSLVASLYDTETMREAYSTACLLVLLHQQRRRDDINVLSEALNGSAHQQGPVAAPAMDFRPSAEEYAWLGDLVADMPGLQRGDFDQFLNADLISDPFLQCG